MLAAFRTQSASSTCERGAPTIFGASIDENMGDAIKVTVIATGFDAADEIPVELAAPARAIASPPTRRETMRDSLREGFSNAPASRSAFSTARPVAPEMTTVSTRRPAALAASLQAGATPLSSSMPEVRQRITFPAGIDGDADWDTPAFQRRGGG